VGLICTTGNLQEKNSKTIKRSPVIQALQLTALFVGGAIQQQKQPHASSVGVALAEFRFRNLVNSFMEPRIYDKISLCKVLYAGLLAE
jgi:hypothetical protein